MNIGGRELVSFKAALNEAAETDGLSPYFCSYEMLFIISLPSSAVNAFRVLVLTFPYDPTLMTNDITASSFGATIIMT